MSINPIQSVLASDLTKAVSAKRYESGLVISFAGGIAEIDVGARLPSGAAQYLTLPVATGFTPTVGQTVGILYPNDNPNGAYVVACGDASQIDPALLNRTALCFSLRSQGVAAVKYNAVGAVNSTGRNLRVLGVTFCSDAAPSTTHCDIKVGGTGGANDGTSILTGEVNIVAAYVIYPGVLVASAEIPADSNIYFAIHSANTFYLSAHIWCTAPLL
jgi:hypothetical protein